MTGRVAMVPSVDGRNARAVRTREIVADAFLDLLTQGVLRPMAQQVAKRAGVSERAVFRHFDDLEGLFAVVAERQTQRLTGEFSPVPTNRPLSERIAALVAQRARLYEANTPVRRASLLQEPFSFAIATRLKHWRNAMRADVARIFAAELARLPSARRTEVRDALGVAVSWSAWEHLRRHAGLPPARAKRAVARMLTALTETPADAKPRPRARPKTRTRTAV